MRCKVNQKESSEHIDVVTLFTYSESRRGETYKGKSGRVYFVTFHTHVIVFSPEGPFVLNIGRAEKLNEKVTLVSKASIEVTVGA